MQAFADNREAGENFRVKGLGMSGKLLLDVALGGLGRSLLKCLQVRIWTARNPPF